MSALTILLLTAVSLPALIFDVTTGKIPNLLTFAGLGAGILTAVITGGPAALPACLAGIFLPFLLLWPLFVLRMMGGGDIKLLMALGGLTGYPGIVRLCVFSVLAGSVLAVGRMLTTKSFASRLRRFTNYIRDMAATDRLSRYPGTGDREARLPFAAPVFMGTVLYVLNVLQPWQA